ncbi:sulfurtransferase [Mariniblastus fucicola]|uniref:tRNA uridine(34) hydroxylase n=1 Tax=Mariniblastus fucicola TaxID=980251 RepID=A0A5B9P5U2_9BACT|nr:sulfurtransferase [Mariniblastus fucicola]QEG21937.1 Ribosomal large subunit pseudouridine synthase C [Mariniblastus fucicola]
MSQQTSPKNDTSPDSTAFVNVSAYKFVPIENPPELRAKWLPLCKSLGLKGTILLSDEGINMFIAGGEDAMDQLLDELASDDRFSDLPIKKSYSDYQPFNRMLIRLKKEIISMGVPTIVPSSKTSPKISAAKLKQWLDEGKELTLLDTRNDYEVEIGTFKGAHPIGIDHFRQFPDATKELDESVKKKPIVMFCTGGIRCEKAGPLMEQEGFEEVYQLDGGILRYFEEVGGEHWDGECFVFDQRVAVAPDLTETETTQCYACQAVLTGEDQKSPLYDPPNSCAKCYVPPDEKLRATLAQRNDQLRAVTNPLPGSEPYNNVRPVNVSLKFDHRKCLDMFLELHGHVEDGYWEKEFELGRIVYKGQPMSPDDVVRSGFRVEHLLPQTTEPAVSTEVEFLYEDDAIAVLNKPAPLPMHPGGRFNRNTLNHFLDLMYEDCQMRITHRLDANTTGVVVYAKKRSIANSILPQFKNGTVEKAYLALVSGEPKEDTFSCDASIGKTPDRAGTRLVDADGDDALTDFEVLDRRDGQCLLLCRPKTGRTNQIRIHLSHLGLPIVGDPAYGREEDRIATQTLDLDSPPMCLHAWKLSIDHPISGERMEFEAPRPDWA